MGVLGRAKIGVIVPVFNKLRFLVPSLESIVAAARNDGLTEVVVIDHGSTDGSREFLEAQTGVRLYAATGGTIGELRNAGAELTDADILLFFDSDVVVPVDYLARLRAELVSTNASVIGCEVGVPSSPHWIEGVWHRLVAKPGDGPRPYLNAASFAVTRDVFDSVGGFAAGLVTGEDSDLCRRLAALGHSAVQAQSLEVVHLDNPQTISAFFRKERWRGLGALKAAEHVRLDRVLTMTLVWSLTIPVGLYLLIRGVTRPSIALACLGVVVLLAVPLLTIAFRVHTSKRWVPLGQSLVLVSAFYAGRLSGLLASLGSSGQDKRNEPLKVTALSAREDYGVSTGIQAES